MINNFDVLNDIERPSFFQKSILHSIENLLSKVDKAILASTSFIEISKELIIISLVHTDNPDSIITLNIHEEYASLWYSQWNINFNNYIDDFDIESFKLSYFICLSGKYNQNGDFIESDTFKSFFS